MATLLQVISFTPHFPSDLDVPVVSGHPAPSPGAITTFEDSLLVNLGYDVTVAREQIRKVIDRFLSGSDRTSTLIKQFLEQFVGNAEVAGERIDSTWRSALQRLAAIKSRASAYATIITVTDLIAKAGAPVWAKRARTEPCVNFDPVLPSDWRDAWDDTRLRLQLGARNRARRAHR